jgi:hypothetical protein
VPLYAAGRYDQLILEYSAKSARDTRFSLQSNVFLNLAKHEEAAKQCEGVGAHTLQLHCDRIVGFDQCTPSVNTDTADADQPQSCTSELLNGIGSSTITSHVAHTPLDFRDGAELRRAVGAVDFASRPFVCLLTNGHVSLSSCAFVGELWHATSGRCMTLRSTEPVVQLGIASMLHGKRGKDDVRYDRHGAVSIALLRSPPTLTQDVDAVDAPPTDLERKCAALVELRAGVEYRQRTELRFCAR